MKAYIFESLNNITMFFTHFITTTKKGYSEDIVLAIEPLNSEDNVMSSLKSSSKRKLFWELYSEDKCPHYRVREKIIHVKSWHQILAPSWKPYSEDIVGK